MEHRWGRCHAHKHGRGSLAGRCLLWMVLGLCSLLPEVSSSLPATHPLPAAVRSAPPSPAQNRDRSPGTLGPDTASWLGPDFAQLLQASYLYQWHILEANGGGISLTIHHFPGYEPWAAEQVQQVLQSIPVLERLTGVPFPFRAPLHIYQIRPEELGVAGLNIQDAGILLSGEEDVLVHELAHYWVGADLLPERWMAEGLAELYAHLVHLGLEGRPWRPLPLERLRRHTHLDAPLALWGDTAPTGVLEQNADVHETEVSRFFYGKSFLFWYSLRVAYGPGFPRELHRWLRGARGKVGIEDLLTWLPGLGRERVPSPWHIFPGWLVEGPYSLGDRPQSLEWYLDDDDHDGVFNLEELLQKTNPGQADSDQDGLGDGWELWEGKNPLRPDRLRRQSTVTWVPAQRVPTSTRRFVRAGETLRLKAEGLWNTGAGPDAWSGPEGIPGGSESAGELVAQIGLGTDAGKLYRIGRESTITADKNGILYLSARGGGLEPALGRLRVTVKGGLPLPELDLTDLTLDNRLRLLRTLREAGFTAIELLGEHVVLSLHPTDLETLREPDRVLRWLDDVVELYQAMFNLPLPPGQRVLFSFDVGNRQALRWTGSAMVFSFGLEELQALPEATHPSRATYPFICALAMPFLQRLDVEGLLEPAAVQALAELMALHIYQRSGQVHPGTERTRAWLASYRLSLDDPDALRRDPRVLFAFFYGLYQDYGVGPFLTTLHQWSRSERARWGEGPAPAWQSFLIEFSEAAGFSLVSRFEDWGLPVTEKARSILETLPIP